MENARNPYSPYGVKEHSLHNLLRQPVSVFQSLKYIAGLSPFDLYIYSNKYVENNHLLTVNEGSRNIFLQIQRGPFISSKNLFKSHIQIMDINRLDEVIQRKEATVAGQAIMAISKSNKLFATMHKLLEKMDTDFSKLGYPAYLLTIVYKEQKGLRHILLGYPANNNAN